VTDQDDAGDRSEPPYGFQPYLPPVWPEPDATAIAQLPPDVPAFFGRSDELKTLTSLLEKPTTDRAKVLAIYGKPGVGKSALAIHFAHQVKHRYSRAQLYWSAPASASYTATQDDAIGEVVADLLRALGVKGEAVPPSVEDMTKEFRSLLARESALILLDGFESERLVDLIPASTSSLVIVTSRKSMSQLTQTRLRLDVLDESSAVNLLAAWAGGTKIADEPRAAREIVRRFGRLPLAIVLEGGRLANLQGWSISSLVEQREELSAEQLEIADDSPIYASFSLSYDQLTPSQQRLFRRLSVFTGPHFDRASAACVVPENRNTVGASLEQLAGLQLLEPITHLPNCYQFHSLLQQFASWHFRTDESESAQQECRTAVLDYYVAELADAERCLQPTHITPARTNATDPGHSELGRALNWLTRDRDNLVAAVSEAVRLHELDLACQLATRLASFFEVRAHYPDWQQTHEMVLADPGIDLPGLREDKAILKRSLGKLCYFQHQWDQAIGNYRQALRLFLALGLDREIAVTLLYLGDAHRYRRDWGSAQNTLTASLDGFRAAGFRRGEAIALRSLGAVHRLTGEYGEAMDLYAEALGIFIDLGDERWIAATRLSIGDIYVDRKEPAQARPYLEGSLRTFEEYGDRHWEALTLRSLGETSRLEGDYPAARDHLDRALVIMREDGDTHWEAATIEDLGELYAAEGDWHDAIDCYTKCLEMLSGGNRDKLVEARARKNLGIALYKSDDKEGAEEHWHMAWLSFVEQQAQEAPEVLGFIQNGV
jgi:tetratricopeptide (TPR) repeat protein